MFKAGAAQIAEDLLERSRGTCAGTRKQALYGDPFVPGPHGAIVARRKDVRRALGSLWRNLLTQMLFQVIEDAPVGLPGQYLPYRLSPDSFSEVNGKAEEAMIQVLCGWVEELVQTGQAKTLCMFGRNSGFIGLALQHRFGQLLRLEVSRVL